MSDINDLKDRTIRNVERLDKHRVRLEALEDKQYKAIGNQIKFNQWCQEQILELRNQIQNNSVADLNHYNELKEELNRHVQCMHGYSEIKK